MVDEVVVVSACGVDEDGEVEEVGNRRVYRGPELSHRAIKLLVARSFTDKPKGSNSMEQELSVVN